MYIGRRGRPKYNITRHQLNVLLEMQFTVPQIAQLLQVSCRTIFRRLSEFNLSVTGLYSTIRDADLDELVVSSLQEHPNIGYRMMRSRLSVRGVHIQESRVRDAMRRVDPIGVSYRWSHSIQRRTYRVSCPNALWHIDGNHSLIRWKFVVHGGIDGYSRYVVYLQCSGNNRAATVFDLFMQAVANVGCPSRVRSDQGGENVDVATFMVMNRGTQRGSHITGPSVHNQRIERLWRDVFASCLSLFYYLFYYLEDTGLLEADNPVHLYALHFIYLPRINMSLRTFASSWNQHGLSSENGFSPQQLWVRGMLSHFSCGVVAVDDFFCPQYFGVDWNGPVPLTSATYVEVDPPEVDINDEELDFLRSSVDPLSPSDCWGVDLYISTLNILESLLGNNY